MTIARAALLAALFAATIQTSHAAEPEGTRASEPILVELFTSQGCYSCPPADELLRELGNDTEILPLAFHVDYWNHLGWTDPFSSRAWSDRQRGYAARFRSDTIYTPQLVINGTSETVGSNRTSVRRLVEEHKAARSRRAPVPIDLRVSGDDTAFEVRVQTEVADGASLYVAVYERGLETAIPAGENRNKTLRYDYVVRALHRVKPGAVTSISKDDGWGNALGLVAFVQDRSSGRILAAARHRAPKSPRHRPLTDSLR